MRTDLSAFHSCKRKRLSRYLCMANAFSDIHDAVGRVPNVILVRKCKRDMMRKPIGHAEKGQNM